MKVFELERLLAQVTDKEQEVFVGFTSKVGEYSEGHITSIDAKSVVGSVFLETEEED